jgi:hypothetical protein
MQFCQSCNCSDCYNKPETKEIRNEAIKSTKERNASAFKAKIHKTGTCSYNIANQRCGETRCDMDVTTTYRGGEVPLERLQLQEERVLEEVL